MEEKSILKSTKKELFIAFLIFIFAAILLFVLIDGLCKDINTTSDGWIWIYYFTNQSNVLVDVWLFLLAISLTFPKYTKLSNFVRNRTVMTAIAVYISIVFLIVLFVLTPFYKGTWLLNNFGNSAKTFTHFFSAIVVWILFFIIPSNGKVKNITLLYILCYPFAYFLMNIIVGPFVKFSDPVNIDVRINDHAYAYDFINPNSYGEGVVGYLILSVVVVVLVGVFYLFSFLLNKFKNFVDNYSLEEQNKDSPINADITNPQQSEKEGFFKKILSKFKSKDSVKQDKN